MILLKFMFVILVSLYVNFPFYFKEFYIYQYGTFYFLVAVYVFLNWKSMAEKLDSLKQYKRYLLYSLLCWGVVAAWGLITIVINSSYEFSYLKILLIMVRDVFRYCFMILLIQKYISKNSLMKSFCKVYIFTCCLYVLATIVMIIFPDFKEIWKASIASTDIDEELSGSIEFITRYGLMGFSGMLCTMQCSVGIIFNLYLIDNAASIKEKISSFYYFTLPIMLLGNFFYGRSGIIFSLFCIAFYFIFSMIKRKTWKQFIYIVGIAVVMIFLIINTKDYIENLDGWFQWVMSPIESLLASDENISIGDSGDMMFDMYFLPEDKTILFGDGYFTSTNGEYYHQTDVGIMRSTLFYGIFGATLGYLIYFIPWFGLWRFCTLRKKYSESMLCFMLLCLCIFFEIKGHVFYFSVGILQIVYLLIIYEHKNIEL